MSDKGLLPLHASTLHLQCRTAVTQHIDVAAPANANSCQSDCKAADINK